MNVRATRHCLISFVSVVALAGCGPTADRGEQGSPVEKSGLPSAAGPANDAGPSADLKPKGHPTGASPDGAVRALLDGMAGRNPKALWDFLPESYQSDVNGVAREFARTLHPDTWDWSFRVGEKLSRLLKTKKALILAYPRLQKSSSNSVDEIDKNWDAAVSLLDTLLKSELADIRKLETVDVGSFLELTGAPLMSQIADISRTLPDDPIGRQFGRRLTDMKVELVRRDGESAVVKLTPADADVPPTDVAFVRVEGKWIPKTLADGWKPGIADLRERIAAMQAARDAEPSPGAAIALSQLETMLDELQAIDEPTKFHDRLDEGLMMLSMLIPGAAVPPPVSTTAAGMKKAVAPAAEAAVTVVIEGRLDPEREEMVCNALNVIVDDELLALTEVPLFAGGETTIRVWPVVDVEAFAQRIDFARVTSVDPEAKRIAIQLEPAGR